MLSIGPVQNIVVWKRVQLYGFSWIDVYPFQNKPVFLHACSIFSFYHNVFYPFRELSTILIKLQEGHDGPGSLI